MRRLLRRLSKSFKYRKDRWFGIERRAFKPYAHWFEAKVGLEVGGPSALFRDESMLPVYPRAARVDGVNFATRTTWEGRIAEGMTYDYGEGRFGRQYVREASCLEGIADGGYGFVLSCHSLEHSANPLKCLGEWRRVLEPEGKLLLVLPDPRYTFDRRRPVTQFEHLLEDFHRDTGEDDLTHVDEVVALHDPGPGRGAGEPRLTRASLLDNATHRTMHHHVFDATLLHRVLLYFGFRPRFFDEAPPHHLIVLADLPG